VLGLAGARFPAHSGTVFGILFTVALAGGMTIPWMAGHLADAAGLRWVFVLAAINFVAVALLNIIARRSARTGLEAWPRPGSGGPHPGPRRQ
jgi:fucose permease